MSNTQLVSEIEAVTAKTAKGAMQDLLDRAKEALETQTVTVDPSAELNAKKLQVSIEKAEDLTSSELGVLVAQGQQKVISGYEAVGKMLVEAGEDYKKVIIARDAVVEEIKALTKTKAELLTLAQVVNARTLAEAEKNDVLAKLESQIEETQNLIDGMMAEAKATIKQLENDATTERERNKKANDAQFAFDTKQAQLKLKDQLEDTRRQEQAKIDADKAKVKDDRDALEKEKRDLGDTAKTIADLQEELVHAEDEKGFAVEEAVAKKEAELKKDFKFEKDLLIQQKANEITRLTTENEMQAETIDDLKEQVRKLEASQATAYNSIQAMAGKVADAAGSQKVNVNIPSTGATEAGKR